mmetsp:Transcript_26965/g.32728  ORF Transcript_26965/g.32728 Transcript_26965/m.32728 type:complete len:212 (-) Transcript_26965:364-999(-)
MGSLWHDLLQYVECDESDGHVWANTDQECAETFVETKRTLVLEDLHHAVHVSAVRHVSVGIRLHLLNTGLDHIKRQRAGSSKESGSHGRWGLNLVEVSLRSSSQGTELSLCNILRHKHTAVEDGCPDDSGCASAEDSHHTLLLHDTENSIENVLVVTALSNGQVGVSLHTDESEIGGGTDDSTKTSSGQTAEESLPDWDGLAFGGLLLELL